MRRRLGCTHGATDCDDANACRRRDPTAGAPDPTDCDDGNACTDDACDVASGCTHGATDCDDANACTDDACDPTSGCAHHPTDCDDGDACTADLCDVATGCDYFESACEDGSACTIAGCNPVTGCFFDAVNCDDGNACTDDGCDVAAGCTHDAIDCDDSSICTADTCVPAAGCVFTDVVCDDGLACTADSCDDLAGCEATATCGAGLDCSTANGLCYTCDDYEVGFEDDAFPIQPDGSPTKNTALNLTALPFEWDGVAFDVSDHSFVRTLTSMTNDPSDYRAIGFYGLSNRDAWLTFPYPISYLAFDVRPYLNWYDAGALFEVVADGVQLTTFGQSTSTLAPQRIEVTPPTPTTFITIRMIGSATPTSHAFGLDNLVYLGATCGCVPGGCPDDGVACTVDACDTATRQCGAATACDAGTSCSATNGLCYTCDDYEIGFEDDAFPIQPDGSPTKNTALNLTALPFEWDGVAFDVSDHSFVRTLTSKTNDPSDYRAIGFHGLSNRDAWLTFPYPISYLAFDVRPYLNWYDAGALFEVVADGVQLTTFGQSTSTLAPQRIEVTPPTPTTFITIRMIGSDTGTSHAFGLDNLVYLGATCGCVPGDCPDDGIACTVDACDTATRQCGVATTCDAGASCSATSGLCYSCDDTSIGFEDDAFPSPAGDWTMPGAYNLYTALPLAWDSVLFDMSDHSLVRPSRAPTGDPNDYRFLAFSGLDTRQFWMTFPYPIAALSFDVRQYLNWYDATTRYELVADGEVVLTFAQAPTVSGKVHHAVTFPSPASLVVIRKVAGGSLGSGMGIDNLVYTGATCGCVPGSCPDDGDGDACTARACDLATGDCAAASTAVSCDDANACTADSCDAVTGCKHADTCDDGNGCTVDSCDPVNGCIQTPSALGASCDDDNPCTTASSCVAPKRSASSCAQLSWPNAPDFGSPTVCGESDKAPLAGCSGPVTYAQAAAFCEGAGARLCTATELAANETRGTGCIYDKYAVWSSTACDGGHWSAPGGDQFLGTDDAPGIPHVCTADSAVRVARCCADVDPTSTTPICEPAPDSHCANGTCATGVCYLDGGCQDAAVDASCGTRRADSVGCAVSAACEGCVCAKDGLCCTGAWDSDCAECAAGTGTGRDGSCEDTVCADVCGAGVTACDSGDPCEATGVCLGGACTAGYACDDGDPCTVDTCTESGCAHAGTLADCDGDECTIEACTVACDNGGEQVGAGCFSVVAQFATRTAAADACAALGGSLARIDNQATNDALHDMALATCGLGAATWIGLSDAELEGLYRWPDGAIASFTNWRLGQPDNGSNGAGQDFVRMISLGYWEDTGGGTSACFACQFPASTTCSTGWTGSTCCPYSGGGGAPGCDDTACQDCVCAHDPYCCDVNWDKACRECADGGPGKAGACLGSSCGELCGCTPTYATVEADCCLSAGTAGCGNPVCADCVCDMDPYCCITSWDSACTACAEGTKASCGATCVEACSCDKTSCFE
ncbi:MAG: hypothetical protein R3F39_00770 [Myxococcota bacterium]